MTIWRLWNFGLGDHWATVNFLAWRFQFTQKTQVLSVMQHGKDFTQRLTEIIKLLDIPSFSIQLTTDAPDTELDGFALWASLYFPTGMRWRHYPKRVLVYQFDGVSAAEDKNPSVSDQEKIFAWCAKNGFLTTRLGNHLTLGQCVSALSTATLFVGCDSGMSHIAHSVGVPTYILEYNLPVVTCHRNKNYVKCERADHFISQAENFLTFLRLAQGDVL